MNKKIVTVIIILLNILIFNGCNKDTQITKSSIEKTKEGISFNEEQNNIPNINQVIQKLCSDDFEGRLVGSNGNQLSEQYIVDTFSDIGLESFNSEFRHEYTQEVPETYGEITQKSFIQSKKVNNVIGKISGKNNKKAIFISAHFDHIGKQNGTIISGAIDNASGISVLIQLANDLKEYAERKAFDYDIIFCAFNGEEEGLQGSRNFLKQNKDIYNKFYNINIDSVGYKNGGNILFLNKKDNYKDIYNELKCSLENNGIVTSDGNIKGVSDNKSFDEINIPNVCIIEENVKEIIHTSKDTPEMIDYKKLELITKSIFEFITNGSYKFLE